MKKPGGNIRKEKIALIDQARKEGKTTKEIADFTGISDSSIQRITRSLRIAEKGGEQAEPVSKAIEQYCIEKGYEIKYAPGVDPTKRSHERKSDPVQTQMAIEEISVPAVDDPNDDAGIFFHDTRLEDAVNAYVFILQNTIHSFAGSDEKGEVILLNAPVEVEAIKAAKDIAFKYLSMETEIARAATEKNALNDLFRKEA